MPIRAAFLPAKFCNCRAEVSLAPTQFGAPMQFYEFCKPGHSKKFPYIHPHFPSRGGTVSKSFDTYR